MRAPFFNLNAFYKYKKEIDKKNISGLWASVTLFLTVIFVDLIMRLILGPESVRLEFFVYAAVCLGLTFLWVFTRDRHPKAQDWFLIIEYIFSFTFACHCQLIYKDYRPFPIYVIIAIMIACLVLMNPFFLILGQVEGAIAYTICYYISFGGKVEPLGLVIIAAGFGIAVLAGLLLWYVRIENIAFTNEINYIATGSDDRFADGSKAFWEGGIKYGLLKEDDVSKRKTFTIVFNYTKNKLDSVRENNIFDLKPLMDWDEMGRRILRYAGDPKTYRSFEQFLKLDKEKLDSISNAGKRTLTGNFNIRGGDRMWLSFELSLRPHPISGEIMCTLIIEDVTEDHILTAILSKLIAHDYDMVMCVERGKYNSLIFRVRDDNEVKGTLAGDYETEMVTYITERVADYDRERALKSCHLKNVFEELKSRDTYEFVVDEHIIGEDEMRKKHFMFSYLDVNKRFLIVLEQDVTDLVRKDTEARKKLEVALSEANAANNIKTEFLSRISHEMRTPMNAIMGLASLMEDEIGNPDRLENYIAKMKASSDFLLQLINDMLDMAGIEEGHINILENDFTYKELINTVNTLIEPLCIQKNLTYTCISEIADNTVIKSDKLRVTQIFMNLLGNAVKYTHPGGRVEFNAYNVGERDGRAYYRFVIKDNGIGMSEGFLEHMFEPFTQELENNRESLNGTGLGLSVTKGIVDALGGTISVTSKKDVGTTFVVDLNFVAAVPRDVEKAEVVELNMDELKGRKILVAEDNEINREIAVAILGRKDIIAETASNGAEAVEKFINSREDEYDVILMDIRMPKMNGLEATRKIRGLNRRDAQRVPIIAMTANAFSDDISLSAHSGMNAHLSKPINPDLLYETILKELHRAKTS